MNHIVTNCSRFINIMFGICLNGRADIIPLHLSFKALMCHSTSVMLRIFSSGGIVFILSDYISIITVSILYPAFTYNFTTFIRLSPSCLAVLVCMNFTASNPISLPNVTKNGLLLTKTTS